METQVSLTEAQERFFKEEVEMLAHLLLNVRLAVQIKSKKERIVDQEIILQFGPLDGEINEYRAGLMMIDEDADFFNLVEALEIDPSEPIWTAMGTKKATKIGLHEAWAIKQTKPFLLTCVRPLSVEIALFRKEDDNLDLTDELDIQIHIASPGREKDEEDEAYNYSGYLLLDDTLPEGSTLSFDDIVSAFSVDPHARIWEHEPLPDKAAREEIRTRMALLDQK